MTTEKWSQEATRICDVTQSLALLGRSNNQLTTVLHDDSSNTDLLIRDTLLLKLKQQLLVVQYRKPLDAFYHPNGNVTNDNQQRHDNQQRRTDGNPKQKQPVMMSAANTMEDGRQQQQCQLTTGTCGSCHFGPLCSYMSFLSY